MFFKVFKKFFSFNTTKSAINKGIRRRLELLGLEERITPSNNPIIVNTTFDTVNFDPNVTTLREAIDLANAWRFLT